MICLLINTLLEDVFEEEKLITIKQIHEIEEISQKSNFKVVFDEWKKHFRYVI